MIAPQLALWLAWAGWAISWIAAAGWSARSTGRVPLRQELVYRVLLLAGFALMFVPPRRQGRLILWHTGEAAGWACVALAVAGFAFCWWARLHLGKLWSANVARKEDHRVIDSGPYALVRHPIYTGIILASFATFLMRGTLPSLIGFGLTILSWYLKARMEESYLRRELGAAAYDTYASRVPMLIPFV